MTTNYNQLQPITTNDNPITMTTMTTITTRKQSQQISTNNKQPVLSAFKYSGNPIFLYFRGKFLIMKPLVFVSIVFFILLSIPALAQEQQIVVPYTLADRDRAILTEAKINAMEAKMEFKFDSQQKQLDDIKTLFYWGFGILISLFIFMFGYMIWDRRTVMQPALMQASKA
jgi:hypothetical protein